ncbi:DUF3597 family protein [Sphingomonas glacialis]|uniref:DUF3597 family protein n=1 Tax=Sphingomonas glacialis TaxID=658225 RepID=A0A502FF83_9SPHN|nr:DUF3597 family protein [Sphingomonas glacialis]
MPRTRWIVISPLFPVHFERELSGLEKPSGKGLANELGVHGGADGSAEENIALQKAVMAKLAENGGVVQASLRG